MLTQLFIKDFAIIDKLELDLSAGMTSMTGETGAGKSILLDALGLVLGDRAESGSVRHGEAKTDITATFDIHTLPNFKSWLEEQDLDSDDECIIRRVVTSEGRSKGYINGTPANMQMLRGAGEQLVDIHGQHEHQALLKKDVQRKRLDDYGQHHQLLNNVKQQYEIYKALKQQLETLSTSEQQRTERVDLLRFQVSELDKLSLLENEWDEINQEHQRLANASQLLSTAQNALHVLYENDEQTVYSLLSQHTQSLESESENDSSLGEIASILQSALMNIEEASSALRSYLDNLELDPSRLTWLEERMGAIHQLARKHQCEPNDLIALHNSLAEELTSLENADQTLATLQNKVQDALTIYTDHALSLSQQRSETAKVLSNLVTDAMQGLGMEGGRFEVSISYQKEAIKQTGSDTIEFGVSANPGQPIKALTKVASGGELSRISLAIQMITANCEDVPTLIFDEVDTGIGGGVAEVVGKHLRQLGKDRQVMCVTHLPQVAAQAHNHLRVEKQKGADITTTGISPLAQNERVEEIARMLGGVEMTEQTLNHAKEMIERASA